MQYLVYLVYYMDQLVKVLVKGLLFNYDFVKQLNVLWVGIKKCLGFIVLVKCNLRVVI